MAMILFIIFQNIIDAMSLKKTIIEEEKVTPSDLNSVT
jgi:hypothetical protein